MALFYLYYEHALCFFSKPYTFLSSYTVQICSFGQKQQYFFPQTDYFLPRSVIICIFSVVHFRRMERVCFVRSTTHTEHCLSFRAHNRLSSCLKISDPHIFSGTILIYPQAGSFEFLMGQKQQPHAQLRYPKREDQHFELFPLRQCASLNEHKEIFKTIQNYLPMGMK